MQKPTSSLRADLTRGNINHQLLVLTLPLVLGVVSAVMINAVDTYFVAKLGAEALAAISYAFPVAMTGIGFAFGMGASAASIIGRTLGQKTPQLARRQATYMLLTSTLFVAVVAMMGVGFIGPLLTLLDTPDSIRPLTEAYLLPWFVGLIFLVTPMVGSAILRGYGSTKVQSTVMISASLINAMLDPLLIFGVGDWQGWGVAGAAWASTIARAITLLITLYFLLGFHRNTPSRVTLQNLNKDEWSGTSRNMFALGIPAAMANVLVPISNGVLTRLFSAHGEETVAAFNVATRIEGLMTIPVMALSMGIGSFVAQNAGARKHLRLAQAWRNVSLFVAGWALLCGSVLTLWGADLANVLSPDPTITAVAEMILVAFVCGLPGSLMLPVFSAFQTGQGKAKTGLLISLVRYVALFAPLVLAGHVFMGLHGILLGITLTHLISGLVAWQWGTRMLNSTVKQTKLNRFHPQQASV